VDWKGCLWPALTELCRKGGNGYARRRGCARMRDHSLFYSQWTAGSHKMPSDLDSVLQKTVSIVIRSLHRHWMCLNTVLCEAMGSSVRSVVTCSRWFLTHAFILPQRWRRYVPLTRRFIQYLHGATSQKTAFFKWAVNTRSGIPHWSILVPE
jgi:hypothetical protein